MLKKSSIFVEILPLFLLVVLKAAASIPIQENTENRKKNIKHFLTEDLNSELTQLQLHSTATKVGHIRMNANKAALVSYSSSHGKNGQQTVGWRGQIN